MKVKKYQLEIYFDNWENHSVSRYQSETPYMNINIGEWFSTRGKPSKGFVEFDYIGIYKIIDKTNIIFNESKHKVMILLDTTQSL